MYLKIAIAWFCFLSGNPTAIEIDVEKIYEESISPSQSLINKFCPECVDYERNGGEDSTAVSERLQEPQESRDDIVLVACKPGLQPFVEKPFTDNPGGFIGGFMDVLKERGNITVKYVWLPYDGDLLEFIEGGGHRIAFDLTAGPKSMTERSTHIFIMQQRVWVVAKKSDKKWENIMPGDFTTNYLGQSILLTIYTLIMVYVSRELDKTRLILRLYGMFLGNGVGWLPKKWFLRSLIIVWCFTTYVIVQMYFSVLTSQFTTGNNNLAIKNAGDLVKSEIKILCTTMAKEFNCDIEEDYAVKLCEKCSLMDDHDNWETDFDSLLNNQTGNSFAFDINLFVFKKMLSRKPFVMVPEEIGTWPSLLHVSRDLPLESLNHVRNIFSRLFEGGFINYWMEWKNSKKKTKDELTYEPLNLSQIKIAFVVLFIGWACSFVVFIIEILVKRYRHN